MNSCVLMAQITNQPQLRYTQDNQTPLTEMMVEFPSLRDNDPPGSIKVVAWGDNLANQVSQNYQVGDQVVLEGRLRMNIIDRQEGFKEKRAEFTLSRIHHLGNGMSATPSVQSQVPSQTNSNSEHEGQASPSQPTEPTPEQENNLDDIPF